MSRHREIDGGMVMGYIYFSSI